VIAFERGVVFSVAGKTPQGARSDVWYQYKEGYNNAVRKKIKVSSLK
jgi:hypothetical protein